MTFKLYLEHLSSCFGLLGFKTLSNYQNFVKYLCSLFLFMLGVAIDFGPLWDGWSIFQKQKY